MHVNGSSFLKEIGRSFIVSSLLPASMFLIVGGILFRGFLSQSLVDILLGKENTLLGIAIAGMIALWLAFMLYSGQDSIYKLFEGYYYKLCWFGWFLEKIQIFLFRRKYNPIKEYLQFEKKYGSDDVDVEELFPKIRGEMQELELRTPLEEDKILPTKLGNILRASEDYPQSRYGINSLILWPRMVKFLPTEITDKLEEINNHLVFMLNSSFLSYLLTLASLIVLLIKLLGELQITPYDHILESNVWKAGINYIPIWVFVSIMIVCRFGGWLFYRMGTNVAIEYGLYVRTAFDLYRHAFFEHMAETTPTDTEEAKETWNNIGDYYIFGRKFGLRKFQIEQPKEEEREKERENPKRSALPLFIVLSLVIGCICRLLPTRKQRNVRIT